jgi:hypothetical protein
MSGYSASEVANLCAARTEAVERAAKLQKALADCYVMARRQLRRKATMDAGQVEAWQHVARFCEETGLKAQLLRETLPTEMTEGNFLSSPYFDQFATAPNNPHDHQ